MPTYLISYDKNRGDDYSELYEAIESYGNYWHHLDSTWIIVTQSTAEVIRNKLMRYLDENDKLFVAKLTGEAAWGGFNERGSNWLKGNI